MGVHGIDPLLVGGGEYIHKSHNVSMLLYHLVCPAIYCSVTFH